MAVSTRLKGNGGLFISLKRGSSSAVVFSDDIKSWNLDYEDKDASDVTFTEAVAGVGRNPVLTGNAITSFDTTSFMKFLWDNHGADDVLVTFGPKGNATPLPGKPHFTFTASVVKPPFSNEANADPNGAGAEFEYTLTGNTDVTWTSA